MIGMQFLSLAQLQEARLGKAVRLQCYLPSFVNYIVDEQIFEPR
jgi:hypothetical protein